MTAAAFRPEDIEINEEDLAATPPAVLKLLSFLISEVARQRKRIEELEAKLGEDSSNSNKPPSSDSPYKERQGKSVKKLRKKRRGCRQKLMPPTETREIHPSSCSCGCGNFRNIRKYYTHQHIELPEIKMQVRPLQRGMRRLRPNRQRPCSC